MKCNNLDTRNIILNYYHLLIVYKGFSRTLSLWVEISRNNQNRKLQ